MAVAVADRPSPNGHPEHQQPASWDGSGAGRILIAEDEPRISSFLERGLVANGFATQVADNGDDALALARSGRFDLVILDVGLPKMDGLEVLRELRRANHDVPVLVLTARELARDTVAGLDSADDYLTKPFRFEELLARVRVCLRGEREAEEPTRIDVDDMWLDLRTKQAIVDGQAVALSAREFAMAETFFRHAGEVMTREQLRDVVWGYDFDRSSNIVDVYVGYLRRKLGKQRISSLRGTGYRLEKSKNAVSV